MKKVFISIVVVLLVFMITVGGYLGYIYFTHETKVIEENKLINLEIEELELFINSKDLRTESFYKLNLDFSAFDSQEYQLYYDEKETDFESVISFLGLETVKDVFSSYLQHNPKLNLDCEFDETAFKGCLLISDLSLLEKVTVKKVENEYTFFNILVDTEINTTFSLNYSIVSKTSAYGNVYLPGESIEVAAGKADIKILGYEVLGWPIMYYPEHQVSVKSQKHLIRVDLEIVSDYLVSLEDYVIISEMYTAKHLEDLAHTIIFGTTNKAGSLVAHLKEDPNNIGYTPVCSAKGYILLVIPESTDLSAFERLYLNIHLKIEDFYYQVTELLFIESKNK